jgi:hypothetical protein
MSVGTAVLNPKAAWALTRSRLGRISRNLTSWPTTSFALHKSEHTQNYAGQYYLTVLPPLAERTHTADPIIRALKGAVETKAKVIIDGLGGLPGDWSAATLKLIQDGLVASPFTRPKILRFCRTHWRR